jgi:hypothetical protein
MDVPWAAQRRFVHSLLSCGYFHCSIEVATLKVAEKLYLMLHELVHQHCENRCEDQRLSIEERHYQCPKDADNQVF